ncbi:MAG: hypothetical protein JW697_03800 [Kosmotogaceae bacterium]|nr:hypothetical protein [Kosmotogaceae bacterium]
MPLSKGGIQKPVWFRKPVSLRLASLAFGEGSSAELEKSPYALGIAVISQGLAKRY